MKTTRYFEEQVLRKREYLKRSGCEETLTSYVRKEKQTNGRIRYWAFIPELGVYEPFFATENTEVTESKYFNIRLRR